MAARLNLKSGIFLIGLLLIIGVGIIYAVQIQREVSGSVIIGTVETVDETILVWKSIAPTKEPLTHFEFGTWDINAFGLFKALPLIPFWVENGGDIPFGLGVGLVEVRVDGNPAGEIVSLIFKPASEPPPTPTPRPTATRAPPAPPAPPEPTATPAPPAASAKKSTFSTVPDTGPTPTPAPPPDQPIRPSAIIKPGEVVKFEAGLRFLKTPGELGVGPGSSITFTARFTAVAPFPTPIPPPTPTPEPGPGPFTPVLGGVVPVMAFPSVSTWDPHQSRGGADIASNGSIYNQLVEYDPLNPSEIIGGLAESWDVSPDGLSYTFHIRKDVKWTDGEVFDADDVVFSLNRMIDTTEPRPRAGILKFYMAETPGEKVDQNTVKVNLKFSSGAFLPLLAVDWNKILPKHDSLAKRPV